VWELRLAVRDSPDWGRWTNQSRTGSRTIAFSLAWPWIGVVSQRPAWAFPGIAEGPDDPFAMPTLERPSDVVYLTGHDKNLYLRYSPGPTSDVTHPSTDRESGLVMPGLSANPLAPPHWWTRPVEDWVAHRICQYLRELDDGAWP